MTSRYSSHDRGRLVQEDDGWALARVDVVDPPGASPGVRAVDGRVVWAHGLVTSSTMARPFGGACSQRVRQRVIDTSGRYSRSGGQFITSTIQRSWPVN